ncbi:MAG: Hsp20/alpha crystallin family protein [Phycisphaeraceae bacterium]
MLPTTRYAVENPFTELENRMNRLFHNLAPWAGESNGGVATDTVSYPVDIRETEDAFHVDAELPGFRRDEIDINFQDGMLSITAERKEEKTEGEQRLTERRYRRTSRHFRIPASVDSENVDARLEDGVLHLTLPKRDEVKPRKIEVK